MGTIITGIRMKLIPDKYRVGTELSSTFLREPMEEDLQVRKELLILPLRCLQHNAPAQYLCISLDCKQEVCICDSS